MRKYFNYEQGTRVYKVTNSSIHIYATDIV